MLLALVAIVPLMFLLGIAMPDGRAGTRSRRDVATTSWRRLDRAGVAHAALLRGLPHGGALVVDVLLGTFIGDTGAYLGGRCVRHAPARAADLAEQDDRGPGLRRSWRRCSSPGTRGSYQDWLSGIGRAAARAAVASRAPIGDLFESRVKRDMGTKDTGTLFGAHGGALDRVDAAFFTLVAGYYVWLALL